MRRHRLCATTIVASTCPASSSCFPPSWFVSNLHPDLNRWRWLAHRPVTALSSRNPTYYATNQPIMQKIDSGWLTRLSPPCHRGIRQRWGRCRENVALEGKPTNPLYKYYATNQPIMQKPFPPIFCSHYAQSFYLHKAFPFWSYLWIKILIPNILCTSCKKAIRASDFFKGFTQAAACKLIMQMWPQ